MTSAESAKILRLLEMHPKVVHGVNYCYRMNPLVQEIKRRIEKGQLGRSLLVHGSFLQDWLLRETDYNWRIELEIGGASRGISDIATHWMNLVQFILNSKRVEMCADLVTVYPVRRFRQGTKSFKGNGQNMRHENERLIIDKFGALSLPKSGICIKTADTVGDVKISFASADIERQIIDFGIGKITLRNNPVQEMNHIEENIEIMHLSVGFKPNTSCELMDFSIRVDLNGKPENINAKDSFHWIPAIKSGKKDIIGEHFFRSPVVISTAGNMGVALIPTPQHKKSSIKASRYIDLQFPKDEENNKNMCSIKYGIRKLKVTGHVYYNAENRPFHVDSSGIALSFYLMAFKGFKETQILPRITSFIWELYSEPYEKSLLPQTVPIDKYALYGNGMALQYLWQEGPVPGSGGICLTTFRRKDGVMRGREYADDIWFHAWFNNMRTAYELARFGKDGQNEKWEQKAKAIALCLLSAPQERGIFPTIYAPHDGGWIASSMHGGGPKLYSLSDCSWAAIWLRKYANDFGKLPKTDEFLAGLRGFIIDNQDESGGLPCWVKTEDFTADKRLNNSSAGAAALWFLGEELLEGDIPQNESGDVLRALRKGADFIIEKVIPRQKFENFELYYSCCHNIPGYFDGNTHMFAQNTFAIQWCAEALRAAYSAMGDEKYLRWGIFCVNILCLYQQAWDNPNLDFYSFGGFGVMNTDGEWNDARQAQFAETLSNYYDETGDFIYLRRAVAAMRAGFALMAIDENEDVCPRNYEGTARQFEVHGASAENYGHSGANERSHQSGFHWGTGSALVTAARMKQRYGDLWIDLDSKRAIGIDGIVVRHMKLNDSGIHIQVTALPDIKEFTVKISKTYGYEIDIDGFCILTEEDEVVYKAVKLLG